MGSPGLVLLLLLPYFAVLFCCFLLLLTAAGHSLLFGRKVEGEKWAEK